ncbi:MAG TPA: translocation/assembly module TamB domain-containing protein [Steroidobacteraceae bacterium]
MKKTLVWSGAGVGSLVLLVIAFAGWLLFTTSGARWAGSLVTSRFAPQVSYASLDGTVAGGLAVQDFQFRGPPDAARIRIAQLSVRPTLRMLLSRTLRIENARVQGLVVTLPEKPAPEEEPDKPMWVEPPLDVIVEDFALVDGRIVKGRETLFTLKQLDVAARWRRDELRIDRLTLLPGDIQGNLDVQGRVIPSGRLVHGELDIRWSRVVLPASYAGRELHSQGALHFEGTPDSYLLAGELDAGPEGETTHATLDLSGTDARADIRKLELAQKAGRLAVDGHVEFEPVAWQLAVMARDFNPGELLAAWPGRVNMDASTRGVLAEAGPQGSLRIDSLSGQLRGRPIAGEGDLEFAAPSRLAGDLRLSSGRSRVAVRGTAASGNQVDATVELSVASLNDWLPDTAGSLSGDFRVRGKWPELEIAGTADGRALAFAENHVARLRVNATVRSPLDPDGKVEVRADGIDAAGFKFSQANVDASGNQARHRVSAEARGEQLDASIEVSGGLGKDVALSWRGEVASFTLDTPDLEPLRLREPTPVVYDDGNFSIGRTCLVQEDASACVEAALQQDGALRAAYTFEHVPLGLANALAPEAIPGQLRGQVAGEGKVRREADGRWFGDARVTSASAQLVMRDEGESVLGQRTLLLYENLDLRAALQGTAATANLTAGLQHAGSLKATMAIRDLTSAAPGLDGRIDASLPTLAPFGAFVPTIANFDGTVNAQIRVGGTTAAPELTGNVDAQRLQADLGKLGIELRDGRVRGEARAGGGFGLAASVASGKGHLELAGTLDEHGAIEARVRGQNFQAADIPAANVTVTPDLQLTGNPQGYLLKGELTIPRADINLQKLPQDKSPNASPDVVVVRNGKEVQPASQASAMPLEAVVTVKLGEDIKIAGYGLESTVSGELEVRESPGVPTTGSGQLMVSGRYKAYGQDLTIKEGRLLFAGTPLDNPRLAIVAMREIDDNLSTGLRIAGSAQRPIITVISDPNVGEADALSYLVTGKSLNEVGSASGSSQDTLASATRSLEGAGAGLVAKRIGQRLGLDEATVEENEMIGGSALTVGEYLSPRLYLSYGVGLFEPGEVIALRYKLSDDVGVRVQRGSEETRAGVEYRIEK